MAQQYVTGPTPLGAALAVEPVVDTSAIWGFDFDVGVGSTGWAFDFDVLSEAIDTSWSFRFDVLGSVELVAALTFDVLGSMVRTWALSFDVIEATAHPWLGVQLPGPAVPIGTTLAAPASSGATAVTVTSAAGITGGTLITIGGEYRMVTGVSGTTLSFAEALGADHAAGEAVSTPAPVFFAGMVVADKAGRVLGLIPRDEFNVSQAPSRQLNGSGSCTVALPRLWTTPDGATVPNPYLALLSDDRLVLFATEVGMPLWCGTVEDQRWSGGQAQITLPDVTALWDGPAMDFDETLPNASTAIAYSLVLARSNEQKAADGEVLWGFDGATTKLFRGAFRLSGSAFDVFAAIAERSATEFGWRAEWDGSQISLTMVVRDKFVASRGAAFTDHGAGPTWRPVRSTRGTRPRW